MSVCPVIQLLFEIENIKKKQSIFWKWRIDMKSPRILFYTIFFWNLKHVLNVYFVGNVKPCCYTRMTWKTLSTEITIHQLLDTRKKKKRKWMRRAVSRMRLVHFHCGPTPRRGAKFGALCNGGVSVPHPPANPPAESIQLFWL